MFVRLGSSAMLRFALVAALAFVVGSATVATAAGPLKLFAPSDESGTNVAQVNEDGELLVENRTGNLQSYFAIHSLRVQRQLKQQQLRPRQV